MVINMKELFEYQDRLNAPLVAFDHVACKDNFPILPHWHYFTEIIHIIKGNVEATCGDSVYSLKPGDTMLFLPQMLHSIYEQPYEDEDNFGLNFCKNADASPLQKEELKPAINIEHNSIYPIATQTNYTGSDIIYNVIQFDLNFLNVNSNSKSTFSRIFKLAYENNPEYLYFSAAQMEHFPVNDLFEKCISEIRERKYGYDIVMSSYISTLLSFFTRNWIERGLNIDAAVIAPDNGDNPFFNIIEYIDKHYCEPLQIQKLAEMCGMSYSNFARLFRKTYNQSCKEYIEFMRLNKVVELLLMTNLDLTFISQETGFSDCSHLIRTFKKWKGMTPKQWRKSL